MATVRKDEKATRKARQCYEKWQTHFKLNIDQYHTMHSFILGEQWDEYESEMLKTYKKVPLTVNKLPTLLNSMLGEQYQNTPQLQIFPMENCDEETAQIRELIVKEISLNSDAKTVYQVVASQAFIGGFSSYIVDNDYKGEKSFDQEICLRSFRDATKCYWDVSAEDINKTDSMHWGFMTLMSRQKFKHIYGSAVAKKVFPDSQELAATREEVASVSMPGVDGDQFIYADEDCISIQHHYFKKPIKKMLYKLSNGRTLDEIEMEDLKDESMRRYEEEQIQKRMAMLQQQMQPQAPQDISTMQDPNMGTGQYDPLLGQRAPVSSEQAVVANSPVEEIGMTPETIPLYDDGELVRIENTKEYKTYKVKCQLICGDYILDETDGASQQCNLIFVDQFSYYDKTGKQICRSFFQDVKDTQRYLNYLATQSAYVLKVSRFDQWIGSKKNVASQDTAQKWRDPLTVQGLLTFDESPSGIVPVQTRPPELSQSLVTQYQRAMDDLYTSTGLYPSRLGMETNEISGKAVRERSKQGSNATQVAKTSIDRAIAKGAEVINEMIPVIYDSQRVFSLMTPEGRKNIIVNQTMDEYGETIKNDLRKGTFQVKLMPGPSYEGQKEEALESMNAVITAGPQYFPLFADMYAENLPIVNNIEFKNRMRTIVPPEVIEAGKTGKPVQQSQQPNPEQQQAQMQAQFQAQQIQIKQQEIELKKHSLMLQAQKQTADIKLEEQKLEAERQELAVELEKHKLDYLGEANRAQDDKEIAHANNLAKILTHKL